MPSIGIRWVNLWLGIPCYSSYLILSWMLYNWLVALATSIRAFFPFLSHCISSWINYISILFSCVIWFSNVNLVWLSKAMCYHDDKSQMIIYCALNQLHGDDIYIGQFLRIVLNVETLSNIFTSFYLALINSLCYSLMMSNNS